MTYKGKIDDKFDAAPVILVAFSNGHVICVNCDGDISNAQGKQSQNKTWEGRLGRPVIDVGREEKRRPLT